MFNDNHIEILWCIAIIIICVAGGVMTWAIATSDLPLWIKFLLLK